MNFGAWTGFIFAALINRGAFGHRPRSRTQRNKGAVAREDQQADAGPSQEKQLTPNERPNPLRDPRDRILYPGDTEKLKPLGEELLATCSWIKRRSGRAPFTRTQTSPFHTRTG